MRALYVALQCVATPSGEPPTPRASVLFSRTHHTRAPSLALSIFNYREECPTGFDGYLQGNRAQLHDAGYDAYITGVSYLGLQQLSGATLAGKQEFEERVLNRINLTRSSNKLVVGGVDVNVPRKGVYWLRDLAPEFEYRSVLQPFQAEFGRAWLTKLDERSALISVALPADVEFSSWQPEPSPQLREHFAGMLLSYTEYIAHCYRKAEAQRAQSSVTRKRKADDQGENDRSTPAATADDQSSNYCVIC
jgi:hypothetical protein